MSVSHNFDHFTDNNQLIVKCMRINGYRIVNSVFFSYFKFKLIVACIVAFDKISKASNYQRLLLRVYQDFQVVIVYCMLKPFQFG